MMTPEDSIELLYKIRMEGQAELARTTQLTQGLASATDSGAKAAGTYRATMVSVKASLDALNKTLQDNAAGHKAAGETLDRSIGKYAALTAATVGYLTVVKELTLESAKYAARTQTLGVVTDQLARANHLGTEAIRAQVEGVKRLGITTQEANSTIQRMIFAQLDVAKATQLARVAQDAAVIAGVNSSQALENIILGITTGQTRLLHTMGLQVSLHQVMVEGHRKLGREMTENEKRSAMLNKVLEEGNKIFGVYESAMGTVGKQMTSLARYTDEAKNAVGAGFIPILGQAVSALESTAKMARENADGFQQMAAGVTAAGAAYAAYKLVGGGWPGAIAGTIAGGTVLYQGTKDPIPVIQDMTRKSLAIVDERQLSLTADFKKKKISPETYKDLSEAIAKTRGAIETQYVEQVAPFYKSREDAARKAAGEFQMDRETGRMISSPQDYKGEAIPASTDLGFGSRVSARRIRSRILEVQHPYSGPGGGATVDQAALDKQDREAVAAEMARKAKEIQKQIDTYILKSFEAGRTEVEKIAIAGTDELRKAISPQQKSAVRAATARLIGAEIQKGDPRLAQLGRNTGSDFTVTDLRDGTERTGFLGQTSFATLTDLNQIAMLNMALGRTTNPDESRYHANLANLAGIHTQDLTEDRARSLGSLTRNLGAGTRRAELGSDQTGEVYALKQVSDLRLSTALKVHELTHDDLALEAEQEQVKLDNATKIAEIQRRQRDQDRASATAFFDAMSARGGVGLKDFFTGQARTVGRSLFSNVYAEGSQFARNTLNLGGVFGGQADSEGKLTRTGRLLQGTPFAIDPAKLATQLNTTATNFNTQATLQLAAVMGGGSFVGAAGGAGGFGGLSGLAGLFRGGTVGDIPGGVSAAFPGGPLSTIENSTTTLNYPGMPAMNGAKGKTSGFGRGVGIAGAAVGAGIGAYSSFSAGGAQNALAGTSSLLGGAATIMALAGVAGPAAPIVAGVAMAAALAGMLMGNPKQNRAGEISTEIRDHRYFTPQSLDVASDMNGGYVDYDRRGLTRGSNLSPYPKFIDPHYESSPYDRNQWHEVPGSITSPYGGGPAPTIVVQVNAIDAKSFDGFVREHSDSIASAVGAAVEKGYHPLTTQIRRQMFAS